MKNKFLNYFLLSLMTLGIFTSCEDSDNPIDQVFDDVTRGAVLRIIDDYEDQNTQIPLAIVDGENTIPDDSALILLLEEQDYEDGELLESVEFYVTFNDGSPDDGDTDGAITEEVFIKTVTAEEFSPGEFGLPRYELNIPTEQLLELTNTEVEDLFGGDTYTVRMVLNLTDGRSFSTGNTAPVVTGGFFNSPFQFVYSVVCEVPEDYFVGEYLMQRVSDQEDPFFPSFGQAFTEEGQVVEVEADGADRIIEFSYYPNSFDFGQILTFTFSCGEILVDGTSAAGTLGCDGTTITQGSPDVPTNYSIPDGDDTITIDLIDFFSDAGCGTGSYPVTLQFTKLDDGDDDED